MSDKQKFQVSGVLKIRFTVEVFAEDADTAEELACAMDCDLCSAAVDVDVDIDAVDEIL